VSRRILVIDDEAHIREVVHYALSKDGFDVTAVADGESGLAKHREGDFQLVVLDVSLPGIDGLEVCRQLRAAKPTPVLFLSARAEEIDRVVGLELGGDDYLTKPFSPRELVARVKAILRRTATPAAATVSVDRVLVHGPLRIDLDRHEVTCHGHPVPLTPTELALLAALYERPGVVLSRAQLTERAYAFDNHVTERTIDTHVRRIRRKFREHSEDPIATVHGVGYKASHG
jgi:two-component system OmpR family response regulator